MQKKALLLISAVQSVVILALLVLIWGQPLSGGEPILSTQYLIIPGLIAIVALIATWRQTSPSTQFSESSTERYQGFVKWYNPTKGFGFIEQGTGQDLFVHQSEIRQGGFRYLSKDDWVEFGIGTGKKGPIAQNVVRIEAAQSVIEQSISEEELSEVS